MTWAQRVKERDGYMCVVCGAHGAHAHHIKPQSYNWGLRYDLDNGITLCADCHRLVHRGDFYAKGYKFDADKCISLLKDKAQSYRPLTDEICDLLRELVYEDVENSRAAFEYRSNRQAQYPDA